MEKGKHRNTAHMDLRGTHPTTGTGAIRDVEAGKLGEAVRSAGRNALKMTNVAVMACQEQHRTRKPTFQRIQSGLASGVLLHMLPYPITRPLLG